MLTLFVIHLLTPFICQMRPIAHKSPLVGGYAASRMVRNVWDFDVTHAKREPVPRSLSWGGMPDTVLLRHS